MCQAYARGRLEDLHDDLHSSLRIFLVAAVVDLGVLVAFAALVPLDHRLLGLNVFLNSIPMGLIGGLYRATGAYVRAGG